MSEETLLSAARRVVRFFNIDQNHGGLTSVDTLIAFDTLRKQIDKATRIESEGKAQPIDHAAQRDEEKTSE